MQSVNPLYLGRIDVREMSDVHKHPVAPLRSLACRAATTFAALVSTIIYFTLRYAIHVHNTFEEMIIYRNILLAICE